MIRLNASLSYIAKLSKTMKWLKIKMPLSCQNCPVIDGRLTVECPYTGTRYQHRTENRFRKYRGIPVSVLNGTAIGIS